MYNTIRLLKGRAYLTDNEFEKFDKFDTILGNNSMPTELARWSIDNEITALNALGEFKNIYVKTTHVWFIEEYALEYLECDDNNNEIGMIREYKFAEEFHGNTESEV